jgi:hypothetical protein
MNRVGSDQFDDEKCFGQVICRDCFLYVVLTTAQATRESLSGARKSLEKADAIDGA